MRAPAALLVALLPIVLAAAGCGFRSEPTGAVPAFPQTIQDGLGRLVEVTARPQRVLSLDPGLTRDAEAVGARASLIPAPAGLTAGDTARISALHPDLVLLPAAVGAGQADGLARALGAAVYVAGSGSLAALEHDLGQIALATGNGAGGGALVRRMSADVAGLRSAVRGLSPTPVFLDAGLFFPVPSGGLVGELLRLAGGDDVAATADSGRPFPPARLRAAAPQAYLALAGRGVSLQQLRRSRATRTIPAVRNGRFAVLAASALTDPGVGVVTTLRVLVRLLHPGAVPSTG